MRPNISDWTRADVQYHEVGKSQSKRPPQVRRCAARCATGRWLAAEGEEEEEGRAQPGAAQR
eukprot:COSAG01_NODE_1443_length_10286_cov_7.093649_11_plen_62_part_00